MFKIILLFLLSASAVAQTDVFEVEHQKLLTKYKINPLSEQTYCFSQDEKVDGFQVDKLQRIASVSKVLTTLHASEVLDLRKTYTTKIFISDDHLHIQGSLDPYFEEDGILLLFKELNRLGYKKFKLVTFDENFWFYDLGLSTYRRITPEDTLTRLKFYLTPKNKPSVRSLWNTVLNFAKEENIDLERTLPELSATQVKLVPKDLTLDSNARVYEHTSLPLHRIMKSMNVMSKNHVAQNLWLEASKIKTIQAVLAENGIPGNTFAFYTGSGLPIESGRTRVDNLASCRTVLKVITLLEKSLKKHRLNLSDVMALTGGKDLGSFRERFKKYPLAEDTIFAKTGTIKNASALAGMILSRENIPFAVLNHTVNVASARSFQDEFVDSMLQSFEPLAPFPYLKISIFPWDGSDFLKEIP
jgi:D-alanyl-D-alanine carboxypeptidase